MQDSLRQFKADFFKALAHPARIKIIEILRAGEMTVNELHSRLEMEPSGISQQLMVLRNKNIVETRKAGTSVYYHVRDPLVFDLLDVARRIFTNQLANTNTMLAQLEAEATAVPKRKIAHAR